MPPQRMSFRQGRVVELAHALHADFLHDPLRAPVGDGGEGYRLLDAEFCRERKARLCGFRGVAVAPGVGTQPSSNPSEILSTA